MAFVAILIFIALTAGIAFALHAMIQRFAIAVLATGLLMAGVLALLRTHGAWSAGDLGVLCVAGVVAMIVSALVGTPLATARKRRADATRGFDVLTPGESARHHPEP
jgi:glycerol uptake facilitator-like aquaporin